MPTSYREVETQTTDNDLSPPFIHQDTSGPRIGGVPAIEEVGYLRRMMLFQQYCGRQCNLSPALFMKLQFTYYSCMDSKSLIEYIVPLFTLFAKIQQLSQSMITRDEFRRLLIVVSDGAGTSPPADQASDGNFEFQISSPSMLFVESLLQLFDELGLEDLNSTNIVDIMMETRVSPFIELDKDKFRRVFTNIIGELSLRHSKSPTRQVYLVLGWFPSGSMDPLEKILYLDDPTKRSPQATLFNEMRKAIKPIRGWRRLLSLKSLKAFGLYECYLLEGRHLKVELLDQEKSTLSHFMAAYTDSHRHPDPSVENGWTSWVQKELSHNTKFPSEGKYSLELIYGWSPVRITAAVIAPTLFSFLVGLVYMVTTGDVQTAWTISSYIVTAAGAIVALLAVLGTLKEG